MANYGDCAPVTDYDDLRSEVDAAFMNGEEVEGAELEGDVDTAGTPPGGESADANAEGGVAKS